MRDHEIIFASFILLKAWLSVNKHSKLIFPYLPREQPCPHKVIFRVGEMVQRVKHLLVGVRDRVGISCSHIETDMVSHLCFQY